MFRMRFAALAALLALGLPALALAQEAQRNDPSDAHGSTTDALAAVSGLDSAIAAQDSTRAVVAEDEAQTQVDQARLDSLQMTLANARNSTVMARASDAVKAARKTVAHDGDRTKRERARLAAIEKKVTGESGAAASRPKRSASRDSATR